MLKFPYSKAKVKVTRSKMLVPGGRSFHKDYTYEKMKTESLTIQNVYPVLIFVVAEDKYTER